MHRLEPYHINFIYSLEASLPMTFFVIYLSVYPFHFPLREAWISTLRYNVSQVEGTCRMEFSPCGLPSCLSGYAIL